MLTREERLAIYERDGCMCGICGGAVAFDRMDVDHIQPRSLGGSNDLTNLRCTHDTCNRERGAGAWLTSGGTVRLDVPRGLLDFVRDHQWGGLRRGSGVSYQEVVDEVFTHYVNQAL